MDIDYKELLKKYMHYVEMSEGVNYLEDHLLDLVLLVESGINIIETKVLTDLNDENQK